MQIWSLLYKGDNLSMNFLKYIIKSEFIERTQLSKIVGLFHRIQISWSQHRILYNKDHEKVAAFILHTK
jgi:hypothetical protein